MGPACRRQDERTHDFSNTHGGGGAKFLSLDTIFSQKT